MSSPEPQDTKWDRHHHPHGSCDLFAKKEGEKFFECLVCQRRRRKEVRRVRMRIVKIKDPEQEHPHSSHSKHPNSGQKSKCWNQLPLSHTKLVHVRARERERETGDQVDDKRGKPSGLHKNIHDGAWSNHTC
jgi:hypothetical protein